MSRKSIPDPADPTKEVMATTVKIVAAEEPFAYISLEDGSTLTIRHTFLEVVRVEDRWDGQGNPMYTVTSQLAMMVESPEELRKPSC